jgi:hypothetical protein
MNDVTGPIEGQPGSASGPQAAAEAQGRAARRLAAEQSAATAPNALGRTERRRLEGEQVKAVQARHSIWRAWWFYLLLAAAAVAVVLGVQSAAGAPPPAPAVSTIGS